MNVILLAALPALVIGISLGLLGGGGSILTVPALVYLFGVEAKSAVATSLVVVGVVSLVGAARHARHGAVELRTGLAFGLFGVFGASLGSRVAASPAVPGGLLLGAFALLMVVVASLMLRSRRRSEPAEPVAGRADLRRIVVAGLSTGLLTGTLGVGGGFVIVPALLIAGRLGMHRAVGTSLVVIALNCAAGLVGFTGRVEVHWKLAAVFALFGAVGSLAGAHWARRTHPERLRRGFGLFVLVLGGLMLADQIVHVLARR